MESELENQPGILIIRILASITDYFTGFMIAVMSVIPLSITLSFITDMEESQEITTAYMRIAVFIIPVIYFILMEKYFSTTLGKILFDLEIVSESKTELTMTGAVLRNLTKIRPELLVIDSIIGFIVNPAKKQRLFEIFSKTTVQSFIEKPHYTYSERRTINAFRIVLSICGSFFLLIILLVDILWLLSL
ncbi:MAG: RDD family protein [Candidatus Hodarchaeales archaeon]